MSGLSSTAKTTTTTTSARMAARRQWARRAAGLAVLVVTSCATPGDAVADELETPRYTTSATDAAFSLRHYAPYVMAQTMVDEADMDKASRTGFRRLAGYIFGGNQGQRTIAMTAPVTSQPLLSTSSSTPPSTAGAPPGERIAMTAPVGAAREATGWRITFLMPSRYTLATLPVPNDPRVTFVEVPAVDRAVVTFAWLTSDDRVAEQTASLRAWLRGRGLVERGAPVVARYNDPFTLPWNRTNEIWIDVEPAAQ
jgi:hypothetical protein